ncbi:MAG: FAD-binding protein [Elusimicrobiaceae bacterium]|nr:FAD-binding protein [Elusimicrobiaceae bacterium]
MAKLTPRIRKQCARIVGKENVLTDELSLLLYAYDCSLSRSRPDGIFLIRRAEVLPPLITLLNQQHIPFIPRASATNHAGGCATLNGGVILNLTHLNHILEINTEQGYAEVEPGVVTEDLQKKLEPLGFFYAPDPASAQVCTIGGNLAQNASGARCLKYGGTLDHVLEATVVMPDGKELRLSRQETGPDFIGLLAGSEGTLGIITRLKVRILPCPAHIKTFLVTFPSLEASIQTVSTLVAKGILPRCVEAMDKTTTRAIEDFSHAGYPTDAEALLILELDGNAEQVEKETSLLKELCSQNGALQFRCAKTEQERENLWKGRRAAYAAMARLAPNVMVGDGTVPRKELPQTLKKVREILTTQNSVASLLFHAGDGNLHPQIIFDERIKPDVIRTKQTLKQILQACVDCGGTISGEHGIGVEKRALMAYQYDKPTLDLFALIKKATDPNALANPLKILPVHYAEEARPTQGVPPAYQKAKERMTDGKPFYIVGKNSRLKTKEKNCFSTNLFNRILDIDTANYTVTVEAGVPVKDLLAQLSQHHLFCALTPSEGTIGGAVASGCTPWIYAHLLGIEALLPDGSYIRYGGKCVKNAAGYPLTRLFAGSQGKWGLITQLTLRVFANKLEVPADKTFQPLQANPWWNALKQTLDPTGVLQ